MGTDPSQSPISDTEENAIVSYKGWKGRTTRKGPRMGARVSGGASMKLLKL